jgi:molybdate transport system substrate-binding protein
MKTSLTRTLNSLMGGLFAVALIAAPAAAEDLTIFAAASLKNAAEDIGKAYEAAGKGKVVYSFASSADLAKQIENGAPASIFISADKKWMDYVQEKNLIVPDSRRDLLGNSLTLIAPKDSSLSADFKAGNVDLAALIGDSKLAMGDPESVPAGRYGKAALEKLGLWAAVEPKVARTKDVRAALALVERGEAAAGVVYRTDALVSDKVKIAGEFPEDSHPPIVYPIAIVAEHNDDAAKAFYSYLTGDEARAVFEKYGFSILGPGAATN